MDVVKFNKKMCGMKQIQACPKLLEKWFHQTQHISEPKPLFISHKELCVASGKDINVYNPLGGSLVRVLKGHKFKVVSLWKSRDSGSEMLMSCDIKGHIYMWCKNKSDCKMIFSLLPKASDKSLVMCCNAGRNFYIMTTVNSAEENALPVLYFVASSSPKQIFLSSSILPGKNTIAISYNEEYLVAIKLGELLVMRLALKNIQNSARKFHNTGHYQYTCITFHPSECTIAVADIVGKIWLWYRIMDNIPVKMKLHWHSLSPGDLCFSSTGTDIYSAGVESVLVRWHLKDKNKKSFLPRLGMSVRFLTSDPTSSLLAVLHSDSSVSIVDIRQMKLEGVIERVTVHIPVEKYLPLSAGLLFHPPTTSVVKNGRTGHLQFFNPSTMKVTYNLDITMTNLLSQEREKKVSNVDVTKAAMSDDGLWLVTSEACQLTTSLNEIVIKFWFYDVATQRWILNTYLQTPHTDTVNGISFRPTHADDPRESMCASCSEDGKLKVWKLVFFKDVRGQQRNHWSNSATVEFRGLPSTACSFAPDGSLLAVSFDAVLTLWNTEDISLVGTLAQPFLTERILDVSFSHIELGSSSLVARSEGCLCSWDLLSCSLLWRVFLQSTCLAVDTHSPLMAIFSKKKEVFFFDPRSSQPISSSSELCDVEVLCSLFSPGNKGSTPLEGYSSLLHCFDVNQDYFNIDPSSLNRKEDNHSRGESLTLAEKELSQFGQAEEEESKLFSALMARSCKVTHRNFKDDEIKVSMVGSSVNGLVKDLHDLRIHSLSLTGLVSHLGTFLPDLSYQDDVANEGRARMLEYRTIKEEEIDKNRQLEEANQLGMDEERMIKALQKFDFDKLVQQISAS